MSNSAWVNKLHSQLPLNLQEERVKDVLIGFRLRHEVHRVFSIGNRSLVVDFYLPERNLVLECWESVSRRGTALTWMERNAAYVDIKFRKLKENYPGIRCLGFVEARQVDQESLRDFVGAIMVHADLMAYSMEELGAAMKSYAER
jgi:hypothetical protein